MRNSDKKQFKLWDMIHQIQIFLSQESCISEVIKYLYQYLHQYLSSISLLEGLQKSIFNIDDYDIEGSPTEQLFSMLQSIPGDHVTLENCQKYISDGANLNAISGFDSTPLLEALMRGNDDIGELLVNSGARYDFYEPEGRDSIIGNAFSENCIKTIMAIADIDVSACDEKGNSLLSLSISKAKNDIAIALIKKGADIFQPYKMGKKKIILQAIFEAARKPVIMFLISKESPYKDINIDMTIDGESISLIESYAKSFLSQANKEQIQRYDADKQDIIVFSKNQF